MIWRRKGKLQSEIAYRTSVIKLLNSSLKIGGCAKSRLIYSLRRLSSKKLTAQYSPAFFIENFLGIQLTGTKQRGKASQAAYLCASFR
jgi:hypothetical protein